MSPSPLLPPPESHFRQSACQCLNDHDPRWSLTVLYEPEDQSRDTWESVRLDLVLGSPCHYQGLRTPSCSFFFDNTEVVSSRGGDTAWQAPEATLPHRQPPPALLSTSQPPQSKTTRTGVHRTVRVPQHPGPSAEGKMGPHAPFPGSD